MMAHEDDIEGEGIRSRINGETMDLAERKIGLEVGSIRDKGGTVNRMT